MCPSADWDMFTLTEWHSHIHGAARVLSGGPVYISDSARALDGQRQAVRRSAAIASLSGVEILV